MIIQIRDLHCLLRLVWCLLVCFPVHFQTRCFHIQSHFQSPYGTWFFKNNIIICIYANTADISSINCLSIFPALTLTTKTAKSYNKFFLEFFLISFATNQPFWPIKTMLTEGVGGEVIDEKGTWSYKIFFAAKSDTGKRTGPQVPNNHEEPCQKICHSGETKMRQETKKPNRANAKR